MSIYQAMQLNAAGSKRIIREAETKQEKRKWRLVYVCKVLLTAVFCTLFVTPFPLLFGSENSIAGVVILLVLLTVRQADFGIKASSGVLSLAAVFAILMIGPQLADLVSPGAAFLANTVCILLLTIVSCHNVIMCNHFIFVLGYLLLEGYEVRGNAYILRVAALLTGFIICSAVYWKCHRKDRYHRSFLDIFREIHIDAKRTQFQLKLALGISSAMLIAAWCGLPRTMWIGICMMSLLTPFAQDGKARLKQRAPYNILGGILFLIIYPLLPEAAYPLLGIVGGISVGFSASYGFQTLFNLCGALAIAVDIYGLLGAVMLRILMNVAGTFYTLLFEPFYQRVVSFISDKISNRRIAEYS